MTLKFEKLDRMSPHWWSQTLSVCQQIEDAVRIEGRGFWHIETFEDGTVNASGILRADAGALYLTAKNCSMKLPIRIIKSLVKDREAQRQWEEIQGTMEKEAFVSAWSNDGTNYKINLGYG